jgi:hypothetical protein
MIRGAIGVTSSKMAVETFVEDKGFLYNTTGGYRWPIMLLLLHSNSGLSLCFFGSILLDSDHCEAP